GLLRMPIRIARAILLGAVVAGDGRVDRAGLHGSGRLGGGVGVGGGGGLGGGRRAPAAGEGEDAEGLKCVPEGHGEAVLVTRAPLSTAGPSRAREHVSPKRPRGRPWLP